MTEAISQGFILAAGRGKRMQYLTNEKPKPLVEVAGKCLIDYNVERLKAAGLTDCIVNLCYKGEMIKSHLQNAPQLNFIFSEEKEALETGGGIKHALPLMKRSPFIVINSDALWTEPNGQSLIDNMRKACDDSRYDIMLMLVPLERTYGTGENGDYLLENDAILKRRHNKETKAPYIYGGVMIIHPRVFDNELEGRYWLIDIFDRLEKENRLGYFIHDGEWFHVGTPEARNIAENYFQERKAS